MVVKKHNDDRDFTVRAIMVDKENEDGSKSWIILVEFTEGGISTLWPGEPEQICEEFQVIWKPFFWKLNIFDVLRLDFLPRFRVFRCRFSG